MELEKTPFVIRLDADDADALRIQVRTLVSSAVDDVKRNAAISSPWLKGKKAAREYLNNISEQKFEELGLPFHVVENIYFYNKNEINQHILDNY